MKEICIDSLSTKKKLICDKVKLEVIADTTEDCDMLLVITVLFIFVISKA